MPDEILVKVGKLSALCLDAYQAFNKLELILETLYTGTIGRSQGLAEIESWKRKCERALREPDNAAQKEN